MNITYKEIAEFINKTEQGVKYYKSNNPELLEILKVGCLLKKYGIVNKDNLKKLIELNNTIDDTNVDLSKIQEIVKILKKD